MVEMHSSQLFPPMDSSLAEGAANAIMIIERVARNFILVIIVEPGSIYIDATLTFETLSTWRSYGQVHAVYMTIASCVYRNGIETLETSGRRSAVKLPVSIDFYYNSKSIVEHQSINRLITYLI
jgi:hypothetical protein